MINFNITVGTKFSFPKRQKFLIHDNIETEIIDQVILKRIILQIVVRGTRTEPSRYFSCRKSRIFLMIALPIGLYWFTDLNNIF